MMEYILEFQYVHSTIFFNNIQIDIKSLDLSLKVEWTVGTIVAHLEGF